MYIAKTLVSLVALSTLVGGLLADFVVPATAKQHIYNPRWPPHAKFHDGQVMSLGILLGLLALWLLWYPGGNQEVQFHVAVIVAALYWLALLGGSLFPGTQWVDPEFEKETPTTLGIPPQMFIAFMLLAVLIISEALQFL
jgi:hypothetical protein